MLRKLITNSLTMAGLLVFLSHQTQSKKNKHNNYQHTRSLSQEDKDRISLEVWPYKIRGGKRTQNQRDRKGGNLETRERKNPKTREGKNKKQQEKKIEDRGSIHQDPTKTNKHTSLTKKSLLINLCFLNNQCFPGRSHIKTKGS